MSFLFDAPPIIPTHQDNQQQYTPIKPMFFTNSMLSSTNCAFVCYSYKYLCKTNATHHFLLILHHHHRITQRPKCDHLRIHQRQHHKRNHRQSPNRCYPSKNNHKPQRYQSQSRFSGLHQRLRFLQHYHSPRPV